MDITDEEYRAFATRMKRPIPGQSLTNSPETPWPWEKPPQFTSKEDALSFFFDYFTEQERHQAIIETLEEGVPVMDIVQMFLTQSFRKGEINPDLMLLLAEPVAFMIMALGERAGVEDIKIVEDPDDPDEDDDDIETQFNSFKNLIGTIDKPKDDEDFPIEEKLDEVELPSLMARGEQ